MKRTINVVALTIACALVGFAQSATTTAKGQASNQTSASASQATRVINIKSGTSLAAELQNTIDARKAKVGDQVVLKTRKAIKSEGQTVVRKGARLVGQVTEVEKKSDESNSSRIGIVFDRIEDGSLAVPITATITSITRGAASARGNNDLFANDAGGSMNSNARTQRGSSGGGSVLGGVTGTVGGVVTSTTSTAGEVVGATTGAVGSTVSSTTAATGETTTNVGRSLGRIQISESTSTSAQGSSVLSVQGENLKLEKGTTFNLTVNQSAGVNTRKDP